MNSKMVIKATIIIAIAVAAIGISHLTLTSAQTSEEQAIPRIMSYTSYTENNTVKFFVVVGEVKNNLTTNIKSVMVNATFYDEGNRVIGASYSYTVLKILKPGQKAPFIIYWVLNSFTNIPNKTELTCACLKTSEQPITGIEISKQMNRIDKEGYYIVSGELHNNGTSKASTVTVFCTCYDLKGNVMAVSHAHLPSIINVNDKTAFTVSSKPLKISPASHKLLIVANYEPPLHMRYPLLFILALAFIIFIAYMKHRGW